MKKLALLVPLVLALAVAACNSGSESTAGSTGGGRDVSEGSVEAGAGGAGSKAYDGSAEVSAVPQVGPQIVKTASLGLGIAHGSFDDKVGEAHAVADSFGGFVVQSLPHRAAAIASPRARSSFVSRLRATTQPSPGSARSARSSPSRRAARTSRRSSST